MKVVLLEEDRLAQVSDGYARNYLFPKKLAIPATDQAVKHMEKRAEANRQKREDQRKGAMNIADKLSSTTLIVKADAGEEGKLFGSVTAQDVASAIRETLSLEVDKRKINLNQQIKTIGEFSATVKLYHDVNAQLKIKVEKRAL